MKFPRRVLVTGGAGFIGSNFIHYLLHADHEIEVYNLDALTYAGSLSNLADLPSPDRHHFFRGDISDETLVRELFAEADPDLVVHFAAESHVDRSILDPRPFLQANVVGTFNLLEAARAVWKGRSGRRFHHVSTDEVYGSIEHGVAPASEASAYRPNSPYSATKAASDHLVRAWSKTYGLPVTTTLSCNVYGPRQFPEKLIPRVIQNAVQGMALPIYGDGLQIREWLHVDDQCSAILAAATLGKPGAVYNVTTGLTVANLDLVHRLCSILDQQHPEGAPHARLVTFVADRPGHDVRYALDSSRIRSELAWRPSISLDLGLNQTVAWYLQHLGAKHR